MPSPRKNDGLPVFMLDMRDAKAAGDDCGEQGQYRQEFVAAASLAAAEPWIQTHGSFAFAEEYDIERKFHETRLYQVTPIFTNLILSYVAEHALGMPVPIEDFP